MAIIGISGKIGSGKDIVGKIIQSIIQGDKLEKVAEIVINDYIGSEPIWKIKKFAYPVKQVCSILLNIPVEDFEKPEVKNKLLEKEWDRYMIERQFKSAGNHFIYKKYYFATLDEADSFLDKTCDSAIKLSSITIRDLLQQIGTDAMRDIIHPNVWINALMNQYKHVPTNSFSNRQPDDLDDMPYRFPNWLITDVRFPNELKAILYHNGIVIRVNRSIRHSKGLYGELTPDMLHKIDEHHTDSISHSKFAHPSETALDDYQFDYVINNDGTIEDLVYKVNHMLEQIF